MRRMARDAALDFHRRMLEGEWPCLIGMTVEAKLILRCGRTELLGQEAAMLVMTIAARQKPLVYPMVERPGEVGLHIKMASVAELRLRCFQEITFNCGLVNRMASGAADTVLQVLGPHEITVFFAQFMAVETPAARIRRRELGESNDLCKIAPILDVLLTRAMARFATLPCRPAALLELILPVRSVVIALGLRIVTGCADVAACVQRWVRRPVGGGGPNRLLLRFRFLFFRGVRDCGGGSGDRNQEHGDSYEMGRGPCHSSPKNQSVEQ